MKEAEKNIPDGWIRTDFGNIKYFKILGSGINSFYGHKDYLSTSSIDINKIIEVEEEISYRKRPSRANMQPIENSVWFAKMKNTIKVFNPTEAELKNIILSTGFCGVYSNEVDSKLMEQYFLSSTFNNQKDILSIGSTQEAINSSKVKYIEFIFPKPKTEQQKIAQILTKVDEAITQTEKLIAKYQHIKTGLMQDLLTKGIDKDGNIRSEATHQFKDSPLGLIPVEWDCVSLSKCIELHNNLRKPISAQQRAKMIGDYPYYGATGIIDSIDEYKVEGRFVLFGEDGDHFLKWKNQEQTILVDGKFNVSNHAHIVKGNSSCSTDWIHNFYMHRDITFYLTRQGAGRFKLNKTSLLNLPILLPKDPIEQDFISAKISNINKVFEKYNQLLQKLKNQKTGLMQDLLSGKKRVTHLLKQTV